MALPLLEDDYVTLDDANRLREQAVALNTRADNLRTELMATLADVRSLHLEADAIEQAVAAMPARRRRRAMAVDHDDDVMARTTALLKRTGPLSSTSIADHLALSLTRTRAVLHRLEDSGAVVRTGVKRGTRYQVAGADVPSPDNVRVLGSYETTVRDAAIKLDTFTFDDIKRELPAMADVTVTRWLGRLVERGVLTVDDVDGDRVWGYVAPEATPVNRRRVESPEATALRSMPPQRRQRGSTVSGTGRGLRAGSSIVNELLRELRKYPHVEIVKNTHKYSFRIDGREVSTCSTTPGASSLNDSRRRLRAAGIPV